jgi:hypothetical protein
MSSPDLTYSYAVSVQVSCLLPKFNSALSKAYSKIKILVSTLVNLLSHICGPFIFFLQNFLAIMNSYTYPWVF